MLRIIVLLTLAYFFTMNHVFAEQVREIVAEKLFLNLPVRNGAGKTWIRLLENEEMLREFEIELAQAAEETDFWVVLDISEFRGRRLTLWADAAPTDSPGFEMITQADAIIGGETLYQEVYRPQFHFSAQRGWLNDPNGLVYYDGEYHLFFQHNPYGWRWGNMTWGHAVSKDLVHWEELGAAIHPDGHGTIFSGSAVVDWHNTSGFQTGDAPPLVCIFTYAGGSNLSSRDVKFTQAIAYSNDRGRSWTKYEGNPVIGHIVGENRDPKVIWHEPTGQWVMVLFLEKQRMAIFTSPNLREWTKTSELEAFYECPELFVLPVDGAANEMKWILYGASGDYYIGQFDGREFKSESEAIKFNHGDCFYASQTFNDIPDEDGRRIQIAWGRTGHPDMPFNQMMNFPVELQLRDTQDGPRLHAWPVNEIALLHANTRAWSNLNMEAGIQALKSVTEELLDITVVFEGDPSDTFGIVVHGLTITCDQEKGELRCKDKVAPLQMEAGCIMLRLLVDRQSVEIFGNSGQVYMPMSHISEAEDQGVVVFSNNGRTRIAGMTVHTLSSIWDRGIADAKQCQI